MLVRELGEFGLIERLRRMVSDRAAAAAPPCALHVGIGDDAAVWVPGGIPLALTTDTLVDGVHFTLATTGWADLGWKAMAVNLSDLAAMGAAPGAALVTLGLSPDTRVEDVDALYNGLLDAADAFGAAVVGGDIVASPALFVTVALTGAVAAPPMLRSAARPGDLLAVTGPLGASAAGLAVLQGTHPSPGIDITELVQAHRRPWPRVREGAALAAAGVVCAMDVTDGLCDDLAKLSAASGHGVEVEAACVPVHPAARAAFPDDALVLALNGGEDYELVFAAPPDVMTAATEALAGHTYVIGRVAGGAAAGVVLVDAAGHVTPPPRRGWDHLR